MLANRDAQIARKLKKRVSKITPVLRLVVFGSRARGDAAPDSDLDIFIELPTLTRQLRNEIREAAWVTSLESGVVITTFAASTEALTHSPLAADPILDAIETEGVVI